MSIQASISARYGKVATSIVNSGGGLPVMIGGVVLGGLASGAAVVGTPKSFDNPYPWAALGVGLVAGVAGYRGMRPSASDAKLVSSAFASGAGVATALVGVGALGATAAHKLDGSEAVR